MTKRDYVPVPGLAQLGRDVGLRWAHVPYNFPNKLKKATEVLLRELLLKADLPGDWVVERLELNRGHRTSLPSLKVRGLTEVQNRPGIAITTKPWETERESCFDSVLIPPPEFTVEQAWPKLLAAAGQEVPEEPPPPNTRRARLGQTFYAKVVDADAKAAQVQIFPANPPRWQNAVLLKKDIVHHFINHPLDVLERGQLIFVEVVDISRPQPLVSRKQRLLKHDRFHPYPDPNGVLSLAYFIDSDQRIAWALDILRSSIEARCTRSDWEENERLFNVAGSVYPEGKHYPFAPARLVLQDLSQVACKRWRADEIKTWSPVMKYLKDPTREPRHTFIYPWLVNGVAAGYHFTKEAYQFLGLAHPSELEHSPVPVVATAKKGGRPRKAVRPKAPVKKRGRPRKIAVESALPQELPKEEPGGAPPIFTSLDEAVTYGEVKRYLEAQRRLGEIQQQLQGYRELLAEQAAIQKWLAEHPELAQEANDLRDLMR